MPCKNPGFVKILILLWLAWLAADRAALAGDCDPVRLDGIDVSGREGSMAHVPVQDQIDLDICYGVTLSQMVDAYFHGHGIPLSGSTSPLEASVGYLVDDPQALQRLGSQPVAADGSVERNWLFEGNGPICPAFRHLKTAGGACVRNYTLRDGAPLEEELNSWATLLASSRDRQRAVKALEDLDAYLTRNQDACTKETPDTRPIQLPLQAVAAMLDQGQKADLALIREKVIAACSGKDRKPLPENLRCDSARERGEKLTAARTRALLDQALAQGTQAVPPAIAYCSAFLLEGRNVHGKCDQHTSLVIGRQLIDGQCMYLVRNSIGTSCNAYHPDWFDHCEEGKGNVWIDADFLTRKIYNVITLEGGTTP